MFYLAFFPLFVDPAQHQGLKTFGVMAATIAVLTFLYGLTAVLLTMEAGRAHAGQSQNIGHARESGRHVPDRLWHQAGNFPVNRIRQS